MTFCAVMALNCIQMYPLERSGLGDSPVGTSLLPFVGDESVVAITISLFAFLGLLPMRHG